MSHIVEARPAKTGGIKPLEFGVGDGQRNEADALVGMPGRRGSVGSDRIVGAVTGRLNDHAMLYAEPLMQREQHFFGGIGRRVIPPFRESKTFARAEDVNMGIACTGRQFQIWLAG